MLGLIVKPTCFQSVAYLFDDICVQAMRQAEEDLFHTAVKSGNVEASVAVTFTIAQL